MSPVTSSDAMPVFTSICLLCSRPISRVLLIVFLCSPHLLAESPEVPLATAADIEFTVEYSTNQLALGDILYARAIIRNRTNKPVGFADFDTLVIRAKTTTATELVCGFGECVSGYPLFELAPGQELVYTRMLDVFGNDGYEDGEFNPFDPALEGKTFRLQASRGTVMPHQYKLNHLAYHIECERDIQLGKLLIRKPDFDKAVEAELRREDLQSLTLSFGYPEMQTSYLFTLATNRQGVIQGPRTRAGILRVLSRELPYDSSARRAASIILEINRFVEANDDSAEDQAASAVLSLLTKSTPIERQYWISRLLSGLDNGSTSPIYKDGKFVYRVTEEKYERFVDCLDEVGMLPVQKSAAGER